MWNSSAHAHYKLQIGYIIIITTQVTKLSRYNYPQYIFLNNPSMLLWSYESALRLQQSPIDKAS